MSLLDEAMEDCVILDKTTTADGYGGVITTYVDGAQIKAAFSFDNSNEAKIAAMQGADDNVTITTRKTVVLRYGDVVKRENNQKLFVTTNGDDNDTPESASLDMRVVKAKVWHG